MSRGELLAPALLLLVALGSMAGAVARVAISRHLVAAPDRLIARDTLLVNLSGSFVIGCLSGLAPGLDPRPAALLVAGFLGSYTTVSALSLHTLVLTRSRSFRAAALNLAANLGGGLLLAAVGLVLARLAAG